MNLTLGQNRVLILAALAVSAAILFFPAKQFVQQRHQISSLQTSLTKLHAQNMRLDTESKRLSDPNELALLARQRLGLVKPGERAYFVAPTAPPKHAAVSGKVVHHRSSFGRAWHWLITHIRGRS